uniref:Uncharacterized protein n=1 Tax=Arundo donax TaxID=35708 RepID=A0A0A8ZPC4_ARUDO
MGSSSAARSRSARSTATPSSPSTSAAAVLRPPRSTCSTRCRTGPTPPGTPPSPAASAAGFMVPRSAFCGTCVSVRSRLAGSRSPASPRRASAGAGRKARHAAPPFTRSHTGPGSWATSTSGRRSYTCTVPVGLYQMRRGCSGKCPSEMSCPGQR